GEGARDVAAARAEIEQAERPLRMQQPPDAATVQPAPSRHHTVHGPEEPVGRGEQLRVARGVVHELAQPRLPHPQHHAAPAPSTTRRRAASSVNPGPNAIAHTVPREPRASSSRSTNNTVGLDMLPKRANTAPESAKPRSGR